MWVSIFWSCENFLRIRRPLSRGPSSPTALAVFGTGDAVALVLEIEPRDDDGEEGADVSLLLCECG